MCKTETACLEFIEQDPEAAFNTQFYIKDMSPELEITKESDPKQFSLIMMEREVTKMISDSATIVANWDSMISLDKKVLTEICVKNDIKLPEKLSERQMAVKARGIEI